ncbi:SapB/AmfS family lantipeptide [Lentzea tibetensis]|uniref:SapB/AmfS family lantipeptide n=1 Tax=Lentzea tibetensis TaxID=2591470 RepID=A0A563EFI3_9PSEU|nr:SapB/AmfS family lanthipeptide [Lentzea tibetensis]TWP44728.1 SapB/AmfS family lantipeptide [Lentzea tibetensis]
MGFILDMQDLETPESSSAMASHGGGGGGGGSTSASNLSVLACGSHSVLSVAIC